VAHVWENGPSWFHEFALELHFDRAIYTSLDAIYDSHLSYMLTEGFMMEKEEDILTRPYMERQIIVVSQAEFIKAAEEESRKLNQMKKSEGFDWVKFTGGVVKAALGFPFTPMIEVSIDAFRAWSKARESGVPILAISRRQAAVLSFPPAHPREGVVYVGHPSVQSQYHTMADFHRFMFEQKVSEAVGLLMSLGATSIQAEHVIGWSQDFSTKLSLPLPYGDTKIGGEGGGKEKNRSSLLFTARLSGANTPTIPENLVWYAHEPTWQTIANGRVRHGLKDFELTISYLDDFGINLGIKASIARAGLDLGGKFEGHQATVWKLKGQFGSEPARKRIRDATFAGEFARESQENNRDRSVSDAGNVMSDRATQASLGRDKNTTAPSRTPKRKTQPRSSTREERGE
jgi:hypothetical protein